MVVTFFRWIASIWRSRPNEGKVDCSNFNEKSWRLDAYFWRDSWRMRHAGPWARRSPLASSKCGEKFVRQKSEGKIWASKMLMNFYQELKLFSFCRSFHLIDAHKGAIQICLKLWRCMWCDPENGRVDIEEWLVWLAAFGGKEGN